MQPRKVSYFTSEDITRKYSIINYRKDNFLIDKISVEMFGLFS